MQIPSFWAEARIEGKVGGRKRVMRRFGWSDESAAAAEVHARGRAEAALAELQAGRNVPNREQKLAYGGGGLPIREEVLLRRGDVIITRNSYGARCLNEPDVLFADIDIAWRLSLRVRRLLTALLVLLALACVVTAVCAMRSGAIALFLIAAYGTILPLFSLQLVFGYYGKTTKNRDRCLPPVLDSLPARFASEPGARVAVYETPAGVRLLALHRTFDPTSEATQQLFRALDTDPAYALMCALQACFRARLSAKPWRAGIWRHVHHRRPGRWPVAEQRRAERERWVADYEAAASGYAACRFLYEFGDGSADPRCLEVQRIHDELSKAREDLPIA